MRSPRQVYDDHWDSIQAGDMDRVIADYAEDAAFVLPGKVARGHTAILATFEGLGEDLATRAALVRSTLAPAAPMHVENGRERAGTDGSDQPYDHGPVAVTINLDVVCGYGRCVGDGHDLVPLIIGLGPFDRS